MTAMILPWLKFALCVLPIGLAGPELTRYGEIIARLTGLSRSSLAKERRHLRA